MGTPTVEVTKDDVWTPSERLRSPLLPAESNLSTRKGVEKFGKEDKGPHMGEMLVSPRGESFVGPSAEPLASEEKDKENMMRRSNSQQPKTPSIATDFGEMLRNSSQDVRELRRNPGGTDGFEKAFSSPTVLDKVGRKSDIKTVSFLGLVTKPQADGWTAAELAAASVSKGSVHGVTKQLTKNVSLETEVGSHGSSAIGVLAVNKAPRTPTGTPPALVVAMEAEMDGIRTSLQRSLGKGYHEVSPSPIPTRWFGSGKNSNTPPTLPARKATQDIAGTPRLNLHRRMEAAKKTHPPKLNVPKHVRTGAPSTLVKANANAMPEAQTPFRSRLPRVSPAKSKEKLNPRTSGTIPQAPRASFVDHPDTMLSSPNGVPSMASLRAQYIRVAQEDGETIDFASAQEIAENVREWNSKPLEKTSATASSKKPPAKPVTRSVAKATATTRSTPTFMSPTATSAKKQAPRKVQESYTPPGSPTKLTYLPHSARKAQAKPVVSPVHAAKKPASPPKKAKAHDFAVPRTPLPRRSVLQRGTAVDQGALRTPSKEMVSKLDREINAHLESQERQGRMFTPSGQRIRDLLAATRRSEGEGD